MMLLLMVVTAFELATENPLPGLFAIVQRISEGVPALPNRTAYPPVLPLNTQLMTAMSVPRASRPDPAIVAKLPTNLQLRMIGSKEEALNARSPPPMES